MIRAAVGGIAAATLVLAGCAIPRAGPMASDLTAKRIAAAGADIQPLASIDLGSVQPPQSTGFIGRFVTGRLIDATLLVPGDTLTISIFESAGGGSLMGSDSSSRTDLVDVVVDSGGRINVPYAEPIVAAGLHVDEVRSAIVHALRRRTLNPQVVIRIGPRQGVLVSIQGIVTKPGTYPLDHRTTRIVDLLAAAGIVEPDAEQVSVVVRRGVDIGTVRLADIYRDANQNIALQPGDAVFVTKVHHMLTVLGSAGLQGRVEIASRTFSLIDALASVRGASDDLADPSGVFLFRQQQGGGGRPQIYRLDMRNPAELLVASRFHVRDGDAIYITNAPFAQTRKILAVLASTFNAARVAGAVAP